jgi:diguanylate cyclase (GGDEF)-like protein
LRERDTDRQRRLIARGIFDLLDASVVRRYDLVDGELRVEEGVADIVLPSAAERLESALMPHAVAEGKSLVSTHPLLDPMLRPLADRCLARGIVTQLLLVRANGETHGAYAVHWIGRDRPGYERRSAFYAYWDNVGLAVATARERARIEAELAHLHERAYVDRLTGLPNGLALEEELRRHERTKPLSVLALDFDGMREANNLFGSYREGGDVLIEAVGRALGQLAGEDEFAARQHTAGDEFALILPGVDEHAAAARAQEIETALDTLTVPEDYRPIYQGASVGYATRRQAETPGQVLGRATVSMHDRKAQRRAARSPKTLRRQMASRATRLKRAVRPQPNSPKSIKEAPGAGMNPSAPSNSPPSPNL